MRIRGLSEFRRIATGERRRRHRSQRFRLRPEVVGLEPRRLLTTAGSPDAGFGTGGLTKIPFAVPGATNSPSQAAVSVAVDAGKNIVAAGYTYPSNETTFGISATVGRLQSNGAPDPNFSPGGQIVVSSATGPQDNSPPIDSFSDIVRDSSGGVALDGTGDMILVGSHTPNASPQDQPVTSFSVVRLAPSAGSYSPDSGFGSFATDPDPGMVTVSFAGYNSNDLQDQATAGLFQPDQTILVTGTTQASHTAIPLARLTFAGSLDTRFGSATQPGTKLLNVPGVSSVGITAMAFQGPNRVILAGTATVNGQNEILLVRLDADATADAGDDAIDTSFGSNGFALLPVSSTTGVSGLAVDPASGRILVGGSHTLVAFTAGGAPDPSFGPSHNGALSVPNMSIDALALQADGSIVLAGSAGQAAALARYTPAGLPDAGFGASGTGLVTTSIGNDRVAFDSVAIQPADGKIVAAGSDIPSSGPTSTLIARYIGQAPAIVGLSPPSALVGSNSFTLTVSGSSFISGSVVSWDGAALTTTFVNGTTLTAAVPASDLAHAGTAGIVVTNPGGATSNAATFTVAASKVAPTLVVRGASVVYDGNPHPASATLTGAGGADLSGLVTLTYNGSPTPPVHPGTYTVTATFAGDAVDDPASDSSQRVVIAQAVPTLNWAPPAPIPAGTPLSASQLDAVASVAGTYTYSRPAGTVLAAGSGQVLTVTFTPADAVDYRSVAASVTIDVESPAAPRVTGAAFGPSTKRQSTIVVTFDQAMDPGSAGDAGLYTLLGGVKKKRHLVYSRRIGIRSVAYNATTHAATITLSKRYKGSLQVTVGAGLRSADGGTTAAPIMWTV